MSRSVEAPGVPRVGEAQYSTLNNEFDMRAGHHVAASQIAPVQSEAFPFPCYGGNGIRGFVNTQNQVGPLLLIGRQGALCGNVQRASGPFYATEHAVVVRPSERVDIDWAFHMLTTMNLNQYATQSAQPGLAVGNLRGLRFRVPPIEEQRRVAKVLDRTVALHSKRRQTLARLDELTQSVFVDMFGNPTAPSTSASVELGELVDVVRGITFKPSDVSVADGDSVVACLTTRHVQDRIRLASPTWVPSRLVKREQQYLLDGDVLMSTANSETLVGKTCLVEGLTGPTTLGGFIAALRPKKGVSGAYVATLLAGAGMRTKLRSISRQTTNIANIDFGRLVALSVPGATSNEQRSFEQVLAEHRRAELRAQRHLDALDSLFASLKHRAFLDDLSDHPLPPEPVDAV